MLSVTYVKPKTEDGFIAGQGTSGCAGILQLLNPPLSGYRIDITRKNPSDRQKKKDTAPQASILHDFDTPIKRGKASGLLDSDEGCCYDTHIACVS